MTDPKAPLPDEVETLKDIRDLLYIIASKVSVGTWKMKDYDKQRAVKSAKKRIHNEQRGRTVKSAK